MHEDEMEKFDTTCTGASTVFTAASTDCSKEDSFAAFSFFFFFSDFFSETSDAFSETSSSFFFCFDPFLSEDTSFSDLDSLARFAGGSCEASLSCRDRFFDPDFDEEVVSEEEGAK
jgi:hypothetical protein